MSSTEINRNAMIYNENHNMVFQFTIRNDWYINSAVLCSTLGSSLFIRNTSFSFGSNHANEAYLCVTSVKSLTLRVAYRLQWHKRCISSSTDSHSRQSLSFMGREDGL